MRLPYLFNQIASSLERSVETFSLYQAAKFVMCAGVMLLPTILQRITLPAATKVLLPRSKKIGRRIGLVLAINTLGTMLRAVFARAIGLPRLGIKGTLELAAG